MEKKTIQMAPRKVLLSIDFIEGLAEKARNLDGSRRDMPGLLVDRLLEFVGSGGVIIDWDGKVVEIDDHIIDIIYGDDASTTWPSTLRRIERGSRKRAPRSTMAMRLGLYELAFRLSGQPILVC